MELLNKSLIKMHTNFQTQEEVFEGIASLAVEQGLATDKKTVVAGLANREKESTTGFFDGFAIPHTKSSAIQKAGIVIMVNESGVEWNSMDGQPAKFFISLLIPENEAGTTHLTLLAAVSRMLVHEDIRAKLLTLDDEEKIYEEIKRFLSENM